MLLASFLVLGGMGVRVRDAGAADKVCKLATKGDSPVAKACASKRGYAAARELMRAMMKKANADGKSKEELKCDTCHVGAEEARYDELTKTGRERFKDLVARAGDVATK